MDNQQADRLKALWKSGRDKYRSFFAVLNEVRAEIGDDALPSWCITELQIGMSVIFKVSAVLTAADEESVKAEFAAANRSERDQRIAEKERRERERAEQQVGQAEQRAEHAKRLAALAAEKAAFEAKTQEQLIKAKKLKDTEKARQLKRANPNERGELASARRTKRKLTANLAESEIVDLIKRFRSAEEQCKQADELYEKARAIWVEGQVARAQLLVAIRDKLPAHQDFSAWLAENGIELEKNIRAALLGLGRLEEKKLREILTEAGSRSLELIWRQNKPTLTLVEN